jgi:hypothetical protein
MVKKIRPVGPGGQVVPDAPGPSSPANSGQAGSGSVRNFFSVNSQGEYCIGTECFSMRFKPGAGEVKVIVDRNECGADAQQIVDALFGEVVKGVPTVYETRSVVRESSSGHPEG